MPSKNENLKISTKTNKLSNINKTNKLSNINKTNKLNKKSKLNKVNKLNKTSKLNETSKLNKVNDKKIMMKNIKKQNGGDIISATRDVFNSMNELGRSILNEMHAIVNIQADINNVSQQTSLPSVNSPPNFKDPRL